MDVLNKEPDVLLEQLLKVLVERGQSLSFAESCTGGKMSARLVEVPGASAAFVGAIVSYDNAVKERLLAVPQHLLKTMGAVSVVVTKAMALGVRQAMASDWAVAVSGIAGPGGGSPGRPVGTVCFSLLGPGVEYSETCHFKGDRMAIQKASVDYGFKILAQHLGLSVER